MQHMFNRMISKCHQTAMAGLTIIELCIAMMVMSVLAVGVAALVRSGVESQLNDRLYNTMHLIGNNIISDLRFDLARANSAQVTNNGLSLTLTNENDQSIVYDIFNDGIGPSLRRTDGSTGNTVKVYTRSGNSEYRPAVRVTCSTTLPGNANTACFRGFRLNPSTLTTVSDDDTPTQIQISTMTVYAPNFVDDNTYLSAFGQPRYNIQASTFDVLSNLEFQ